MHMWYWFGKDLGVFLFPGYVVTTTWGMIATCFGIAALAVLYEGTKVLQYKLRQMTLDSLAKTSPSTENSTLISRISSRSFNASFFVHSSYWSRWLLEVFHWSFHTLMGYIIMMAAMTYNGYITIALVCGAAIGYWIFSPALMSFSIKQFPQQKSVQCEVECADAIVNSERRQSTVSFVAEQIATEVVADIHATQT
ncbi:probable low affinity copper uptake protein 2 isoform X2 [Orussus abietinus]|uniref:probable low affinity copper uptake protein 2 isoform X2 n=1 Tax=Orussus abietinus TaxID=222816 RepID=UPI000625823E|nr:probable low affinity copper uptake protein 2 isoform X2 [Orussus abietinus]